MSREMSDETKKVLSFECESCGASTGERCRSKNNKPVGLHEIRVAHANYFEATQPKPDEALVELKRLQERNSKRETRIAQVMHAIWIARRIGTTQETLDRHLAEMIVDADGDMYTVNQIADIASRTGSSLWT